MYLADRALIPNNNLHASQGREAVTSIIHSVHFYEDEGAFLDSLSEFVGAALGAGGACLVIATSAHRDGLCERLNSHGIDVAFSVAASRFVLLDAAEVLASFMVDGYPNEARFNDAVVPQLQRAGQALRGKSTSVVAFGEMVALLWQQGLHDAAIELENLWERLAERYAFSLRCAYPLQLFSDQHQDDLFRRVCGAHHQVIPAESYTSLRSEDDRHRMISSLQQQAGATQAAMKGREEDTARLRQVEARLQRSEEFSKSIVECSVDCIKVLDLEGRLAYISGPGLRALEVDDPASLLGRRWVEFWNPEDRPRAQVALDAALDGGVGSFTGDCSTPRGVPKSWDVKVTPALDPAGRVEQLIAISRDITELRAAQQAAIESERQAGAGRMAATVAHEINNPLEAVTNFIFLALATQGLPEDASRYLEMADRELARAAQITRQMLGFYRGNSKPRWVPVADLIHDVLDLYGRKLRNQQLTASVTADPGLQVFVKDGELRQVLLNLTANAVDASHPGGNLWFRVHRTTHWKSGGEALRITVADNGSGMSPEVQRRAVLPFFTTKAAAGTGIGLWITKCLVEQQGGYLHFRSSQGRKSGTVMSLVLPSARNAAEAIAAA